MKVRRLANGVFEGFWFGKYVVLGFRCCKIGIIILGLVNGSVWGLFLGYLRMMNVSGEVI